MGLQYMVCCGTSNEQYLSAQSVKCWYGPLFMIVNNLITVFILLNTPSSAHNVFFLSHSGFHHCPPHSTTVTFPLTKSTTKAAGEYQWSTDSYSTGEPYSGIKMCFGCSDCNRIEFNHMKALLDWTFSIGSQCGPWRRIIIPGVPRPPL